MKEEAKRYFIIMFIKNNTEVFSNELEKKEFLKSYDAENRDQKNPYVFGRLETKHYSQPSEWVVKYSVYKKITKKNSLKNIDEYVTNKCENQEELKACFPKDTLDLKGKLYVGYMLNGEVKTLPVFYKKDKVYTDYKSLKNLMTENVTNEVFLTSIWANRKFNSLEYRKKIEYYLEKIQIAYGKYVLNLWDISEVKQAIEDFTKAWCTSKGKINQRRVRELGSIVKNSLENIRNRKNLNSNVNKKGITGFEEPKLQEESLLTKKRKIEKEKNDIKLF